MANAFNLRGTNRGVFVELETDGTGVLYELNDADTIGKTGLPITVASETIPVSIELSYECEVA